MPAPLAASTGTTAGGVPYPNLADPATAQRFADQAVAGGNPYFQGPGSPQASPQGRTAADQAAGRLQAGPSAADIKAGMEFGANPSGYQAPEFMTPAMQAYVDQFHASQAQMQQSLNSSLAQALSGLKQRRDAAAKVVATLPGEYDAAYTQATNAATSAAHNAASAFHGPTIGGATGQKDIAKGNANARAAGKAAQPLLEAGITADYSKGQTTLANTNMQNQALLADQNAQFAAQMAHDQAAFDNANAQQKAAINADITKAIVMGNIDVANQEKLSAYQQSHPAALSVSDRLSIARMNQSAQNEADTGARANHFTSAAGMAMANQMGPELLGVITSGGTSSAAKNQINTAVSRIMHDPDLKQWAGEHGYLAKDPKTGGIVLTINGQTYSGT